MHLRCFTPAKDLSNFRNCLVSRVSLPHGVLSSSLRIPASYRPLTARSTASWPYIYRTQPSATMAPQLDSYFKTVDSLTDTFIERLRKAVAIPSVSADDDKREEVVKVCRHPHTT